MHGDGYETGQVPLFHVFVHIFGLDPAQNMPFFEKITNQILRLNYAQLICEPVRSENRRLCRVTVNRLVSNCAATKEQCRGSGE